MIIRIRADIKRVILYFIIAIIIAVVAIVVVTINFTIENRDADEKMEVFTESFVNDLLNEDYDKILEYTYISDSKSITVEEFKEMVLSHDDTRMLLQFEQSELNYYNSGDFNLRTITITGRDKEDNFYKSDFKVKKIDGKFWLYFDEISND